MKWALLLLLAGCSIPQAPAATSKDYVHRLERVEGGVCGATAVGKRTLLSAAHCVHKDDKVVLVNGTAVGILRMEFDGADHVLIVVTVMFDHIATVTAPPKQGDRVRWYGNPIGIPDVYGEGLIVGQFEGRTLIDGNIWFGTSGSALFNERGQIVGVVSSVLGSEIYKLGAALPLRFTAEQWGVVR